jgi:hypothetical protein
MSTVQVKLSKRVVDRALAFKPDYDSNTAHLSRLIESALDSSITLDERPSRPQAGSPTEGVSPSNSSFLNKRNKENDFSLQAEEAHVPVKAVKTIKTKPTFDIAQNLWGHEDLIRAYWKAKPKNKTAPAWKLLMTELTKIQDGYGDAALRTQLELAEANRWQGITLSNYERFGLPKGNAPAQGGVDWAEVDRLTFGGAA